MDAELLELQQQFESAQQAKSSIRLSERNVVELVQKLQELHIIDFDLLHTVSGKEYITPDQLRREMVAEVKRSGRVSLIDLSDVIGVDLYHVEKQAQLVISDDPELMLLQGEIISQSYWDNVAEEINERLQECSQIALAELAAQLNVGTEFVSSMLEARLGTLVKGRLEGGQLYTPAYVTRVSAMVRGAARAITVPTNLSLLWSNLQTQLHEMDGASGVAIESSFFQSMFNALLKEGEVLGSLRAGVHWTPTVFANAQKECVDSMFSQNSFVSYDALQKLGITQALQFLQSRYPDGIPLVAAFVHPSMIEILDSAIEDAVDRGSWIDSLSVLPTSFGSQDASKILSLCPSFQSAVKNNKGLVLGDSFVFSNTFLKDLYDRVEKEAEKFTFLGSSVTTVTDEPVKETKGSGRSTELNEPVNDRKKKKGKNSGLKAAEESVTEDDYAPIKGKKNQRKGKAAASGQVSDTKAGSKKDPAKLQEGNDVYPSEEWIIEKILALIPDFEEQGVEDPQTILKPIANHMRPLLINFLKERRKTLLTENAEQIKRVFNNLQKKLEEPFLNIQLYEKALDLFDDDQSTSVILHKHLLRTMGAPMADLLLHNLDVHNKLKNGLSVEESSEVVTLTSAERTSIAKGLPGSLSKKAQALVEALEGKLVEGFTSSLRDTAEESGLYLKQLDKKLERTILHSYRKELTAQVSAETDPVALLPKVVSLLYIQIHNKALQAPGRAISIAVSRLKDKLDSAAYKILTEYQTATVKLLALSSAATGDEEDCTSDRILSKRELLESLMPQLKGLVLSSSSSQT
ncbi:E3 UFM1-protein ligase 1 homolog [Linum grandiflorum]